MTTNTPQTSFFGLSPADVAKLGMNVVLLFLMWQLWLAYQAKDAQYIVLLQSISDNTQRIVVLTDRMTDLQRQVDLALNPRGT